MKPWTTLLVRTIAAMLAAIFISAAYSARIYFTDQPAGADGYVMSVAPDGTDQRTVITVSNAPDLRGIAFHRASRRIYFLDTGAARRIYSVAPEGSDLREVTSISAGFSADLEIDEINDRLYWAETGDGLIRRANLDGSGLETAVTIGAGTFTAPYFMYVDPVGGHIYWGVTSSGSTPSNFRRATLAGVIDPAFLIASPTRSRDIAIDPTSATAYWCDRQTGSLLRRAVSGGTNQTVIAGMNAPHGIALDVEAGKVYWADSGKRDSGPSNTSARRVARCNFDGTEYENVSTPLAISEPWDMTLDTSSPTFADWRTRFFSTTTADSGPVDDADGDGAKNLQEYAMGTHPRRSASVPRIALQGTAVKYVRRIGSDLASRVEVSTNLPAFHYNGDGSGLVWTTEVLVTPVSAELESVVTAAGPALAGASNVFFRVRVSMP